MIEVVALHFSVPGAMQFVLTRCQSTNQTFMENLGPPLIRIFVGTSFSIFEVSRRKKRIFFKDTNIQYVSPVLYVMAFHCDPSGQVIYESFKVIFFTKSWQYSGDFYTQYNYFFLNYLQLSSIVLMSVNYEKKEIYVYNYLMIVHHHKS